MFRHLPPPTYLGPPPKTPAERYASIIDLLCHYIGAACGQKWIAGPLAGLVWGRLRRLGQRFGRLADKIAAGTLPPPRHRAPAPRMAAPPPERSPLLPSGRGWLFRLVQQTAVGQGLLGHLLGDPGMQALIAADRRVGRTIRPLCRMLGMEFPPCLQLPPRPPRPAPAPPPKPAAGEKKARRRRPAARPPAPGARPALLPAQPPPRPPDALPTAKTA